MPKWCVFLGLNIGPSDQVKMVIFAITFTYLKTNHKVSFASSRYLTAELRLESFVISLKISLIVCLFLFLHALSSEYFLSDLKGKPCAASP